nr:hypothetical protein [Tanacetum cinerariifolium]
QKVQNDDHYDVFAIDCQHTEQSESVHNTYLIEQDAQNVLIESEDMNYDSEQIDQNDVDVDLAKERELLASLIAKLKCEIDESKNHNTLLETSNKVLVEKLKIEIADFKNKNKSLTEANNKLSGVNAHLYADYKKSKDELKRRNTVEYATEIELECAKLRGDLLSNKMEQKRYFEKYTHIINGLNQTVSELQHKLSAHQDTISILNQQKDAQNKLFKTQEDKDIEKVIDLENKVKVLDNIVYKTGQSVQTMNMLNNKCRTSFAKPEIGNVAGARETVGSSVVQKSGIQCYNCKEFGHVARECQKPKRAKDAAYHREKMLLSHYMYMVQLQEVSTNVADSGPIFDDEPLQKVSNDDHYNVFVIESAHPEQSKSVHDTYPIEKDTQNVIIDSLDMNCDIEEIDQNDDDNDFAKERELPASLIEKLKCEIDESKNRNKFLETSNNFFKEANNRLSETNNLLYAYYKKSEAELARRNSKEYVSQMELECTKVREMKDKLSAHQETIFILSQQKEAQIKLYKTREDKELDKVIALEQKVKVKEYQKKDKIRSKPDKNEKRGEAEKSQKQLQSIKEVKLKKTQKERPNMQSHSSYKRKKKKKGQICNYMKVQVQGLKLSKLQSCEFTLSSLYVLQGFSFFLQMVLTLILATFDGLDVGLLGDVIGEDDCDDDG